MRKPVHIAMFSTGGSSAYLLGWLIEKYGKENVISFFTDTLWEDEDNYRFSTEVHEYLGIEPVIYTDGRTPEQVFFAARFLGNFGTAPCSRDLKMKQTVLFVENMRLDGCEPILYFGIGHHEAERSDRIAENYSHNCLEPVQCRFPLIDMKINNRIIKKTIEGTWGIKMPRMYAYGFEHANCGGRCVKGGINHYKLLYRVWPERFKAQEEMEARFRREINDYTLLKKYAGKDKDGNAIYKPYSLEQLRKDIERNGYQFEMLMEEHEIPCACFF